MLHCPTLRAFGIVLPLALALPTRPIDAQGITLRGRVLSAATGQPVAAATVTLPSLGRRIVTDSLGRFALHHLRDGEHDVIVQAVGYAPVRALVPLADGPPLDLDVDLDRLPPLLDRVVTEVDADAPRNIAMPDFESRRAMGFGRFITRAELLRERGRTLDAVLRQHVPGVRFERVHSMTVAASARGPGLTPGPCYVNVVVDGMLRYFHGGRMPFFDLRSLEAGMIAGIEYYAVASTPAEFNFRGHAPCGTLMIWLQH